MMVCFFQCKCEMYVNLNPRPYEVIQNFQHLYSIGRCVSVHITTITVSFGIFVKYMVFIPVFCINP